MAGDLVTVRSGNQVLASGVADANGHIAFNLPADGRFDLVITVTGINGTLRPCQTQETFPNEESANLLGLQTRQQLSTTALSLASAVLRLF